jgi:acyl dehydratase
VSDASALRFEDVELGDELPEVHPDVSLEKVRRFCHTTGMTFGRFLDDEAARSEGLPGAIVPGIMSQGLLAVMIHAWAPGCTVKKLDTIFRAPILVGSRPTCRGAVTDIDEDGRTVEIDLTLVNESGETRVVGTAVVAL